MRTGDTSVRDNYGNSVAAGQAYIEGKFLERGKYPNIYKETKKTTYFYRETVVYPFVETVPTKNGDYISTAEVNNIICYVESNNMTAI